MKARILVVEDDRKTAELVRMYLERDGHQVLTAHDGRQALDAARQRRPDLIVLDLMLPGVDGLDVCRILRAESQVPIIMLTARTTEEDTLLGLDLGADDYVAKPFSPSVLAARVRSVLRRTAAAQERAPTELRCGELLIDTAGHEVRLRGELLRLTPKEFRLLETLARAPGRAFSRLELLEQVFGFDYEGLDRTVDVHVMNVRKKIEDDPAHPRYIQTVYGVGYKFAEPESGGVAGEGAALPNPIPKR
ncbi:MAG TPA: response regulator transcription factor [Roseiflexaceae bacterium]|nr:response regulator transcription factor [Roseiflexaceae bacterium]